MLYSRCPFPKIWMKDMKTLWISLVLLAVPAIGSGEVLLIDAVKQEQRSSIPRPHNGDSMTEVERRFGSPLARKGPVGEPPISRWDYADFSVYFERDKVITSVLKRNKVQSDR